MKGMSNDRLVKAVRDFLSGSQRIGVTELARSKEWRKRLPDACCYEIVDRTETVGFILSPECAAALNERIEALEQELEEYRIREMFESRQDYGEFVGGEQLTAGALDCFQKNKEQLMRFENGCTRKIS